MPKFTFIKTYPKNIPLFFRMRANELGSDIFQYAKDQDGNYQGYSYAQVYDEVIALAHELKKMGIAKDNNVGLISDNCREWALTDYALLSLGAADVPRGCDSMGTEIRFILNFADCQFSFFETVKQLEKVLEHAEEVPNLKTAIIFKKPTSSDTTNSKTAENSTKKTKKIKVLYFEDILKNALTEYNADKEKIKNDIETDMQKIEPSDTATIIFTSGTTGTPKGVMLTHRNYLAQIEVVHNFFNCHRGERWLTVLPVWHSFERAVQYFIPALKCSVTYSKPIPQVMIADMKKMQPNWMCGVPRLWDGIAKSIDRNLTKKKGLTPILYKFFVAVGKSYVHQKDKVRGWICQIKKRNRFLDFLTGLIPFFLLWPLHKLGDVLVFKKIKQVLGGKIKIALSGGGALQKDVNDFYRAMGINLLEGYGLTETAPVVSVRYYKEPRSNCVGVIFPSVEVKIVKEHNGAIENSTPLKPGQKGLVLVKSEQIMKGYYKRPDLSKTLIDKDGYLNTGDIGLLTFNNELVITGRAKDTIVLSGGENVEPAIIERALNSSDYIESSIVLGQDKNALGCLIVCQKDKTEEYAKENNILYNSYEELLKDERILTFFSKSINLLVSVANGFRSCERINNFALIAESFKPGEELSAKGEMIRSKISKKYQKVIELLF